MYREVANHSVVRRGKVNHLSIGELPVVDVTAPTLMPSGGKIKVVRFGRAVIDCTSIHKTFYVDYADLRDNRYETLTRLGKRFSEYETEQIEAKMCGAEDVAFTKELDKVDQLQKLYSALGKTVIFTKDGMLIEPDKFTLWVDRDIEVTTNSTYYDPTKMQVTIYESVGFTYKVD